jgi:hypothetical protein
LVQSREKMANPLEDQVGSAPCPAILRLANDFIPRGAKLMLLWRKSVVYIKVGELPEDVWEPRWGVGAKELPGDVDQDGERGAFAMPDVPPEGTTWYAKFVLDKRVPALIAFTRLNPRDHASDYLSYMRRKLIVTPAS